MNRSSRNFLCIGRFAAAITHGSQKEIQEAAQEILRQHPPDLLREVLWQCHLFAGFPKVIRAVNSLHTKGLWSKTEGIAPHAADREAGKRMFRSLYGEDSDRVLGHLEGLSPDLAQWILDHAYGRIMNRPGFEPDYRERLAVLALANCECWSQWESHVRNCARLGIPKSVLLEDMQDISWLTKTQQETAQAKIAELSFPPPETP